MKFCLESTEKLNFQFSFDHSIWLISTAPEKNDPYSETPVKIGLEFGSVG